MVAMNKNVRPILVGTAFTMPLPVDVADMLRFLKPQRPDGNPVTPEGVFNMVGMTRLALDINTVTGRRRTREEGGMTDNERCVKVVKEAMAKAKIAPKDIDNEKTAFVHVSCTPSFTRVGTATGLIMDEVGLPHVYPEFHDLGCAGLVFALQRVRALMTQDEPYATVVVVISNTVEGAVVGYDELYERVREYTKKYDKDAWMSALFTDGAGCLIFRAVPVEEAGSAGLIAGRIRRHSADLVFHPAGGTDLPSITENAHHQVYLMRAKNVAEKFVEYIEDAFTMLQEDWDRCVAPVLGKPFARDLIIQWILHQPNLKKIHDAARRLDLPLDRVPTNVDLYGNLTAASGIELINSGLRCGRLQKGNHVVLLQAGAGMGGMDGYAVLGF